MDVLSDIDSLFSCSNLSIALLLGTILYTGVKTNVLHTLCSLLLYGAQRSAQTMMGLIKASFFMFLWLIDPRRPLRLLKALIFLPWTIFRWLFQIAFAIVSILNPFRIAAVFLTCVVSICACLDTEPFEAWCEDVSLHCQSTLRTLRGMQLQDKVHCSVLLGAILGVVTSRDMSTLVDTFVMVFFYSIWLLVCLPSLSKRLTVKFISNVVIVLGQIFFADVCIFGVYKNFRWALTGGEEVSFESMEQLAYMFLMNAVRTIFLLACLLRMVPVYRKVLSNTRVAQSKSQCERVTLVYSIWNAWLPWKRYRSRGKGRSSSDQDTTSDTDE